MTTATITRTRFGGESTVLFTCTDGEVIHIHCNEPNMIELASRLPQTRYDCATRTWTVPVPDTEDAFANLVLMVTGLGYEYDYGIDVAEAVASRAARFAPKSKSTPSVRECSACRATDVPTHKDNYWRLRVHRAGEPYSEKRAYAGKSGRCGVAADTFLTDLRNAGLAMAGDGMRLMTDAEIREQDTTNAAHDNGRLF